MLDIRDHGGHFGGGKSETIQTKIIKGKYNVPFAQSGNGSARIGLFQETQNYFWYEWYDNGKVIVRFSKKDPMDIRHVKVNETWGNYTTLHMIPLYDEDKLAFILASSSYFSIIDSSLKTVFTTGNFFPRGTSNFHAYYFDKTNRKIFFVFGWGDERRLAEINVSNPSSPTLLRDVLFYSIGGGQQYTYVAFEPENNILRLMNTYSSGTQVNRKYILSDSATVKATLVSTHSESNSHSPMFGIQNRSVRISKDYTKIFQLLYTSLQVFDVNTYEIIATKDQITLKNDIQAKLPINVDMLQSSLLNDYTMNLPNGNFLIFYNIVLNTGLINNLNNYVAVEVDKNLDIIDIEPALKAVNGRNINSHIHDLGNQEFFIVDSYSTPDMYLLK